MDMYKIGLIHQQIDKSETLQKEVDKLTMENKLLKEELLDFCKDIVRDAIDNLEYEIKVERPTIMNLEGRELKVSIFYSKEKFEIAEEINARLKEALLGN